jgi:hypothetical protein
LKFWRASKTAAIMMAEQWLSPSTVLFGSLRVDVTLAVLALGLPNTAIVDQECNRDYAENDSQSGD